MKRKRHIRVYILEVLPNWEFPSPVKPRFITAWTPRAALQVARLKHMLSYRQLYAEVKVTTIASGKTLEDCSSKIYEVYLRTQVWRVQPKTP